MDGVGSFFFGSNVAWSWCCEYSVLVTARVTRDGDKAKACETVIYREARSTLRRLKATVNAEWIRAAVLMMVKEEGGRHHNKPKKCLFGNCRMVPSPGLQPPARLRCTNHSTSLLHFHSTSIHVEAISVQTSPPRCVNCYSACFSWLYSYYCRGVCCGQVKVGPVMSWKRCVVSSPPAWSCDS